MWVIIGGDDPQGRIYLREQIDIAKVFPLGISAIYPAPTLAELLEMLSTRVHGIEIHDCTCGWSIQVKTEEPELDFNPATAALRLLLRLEKEIEVSQ